MAVGKLTGSVALALVAAMFIALPGVAMTDDWVQVGDTITDDIERTGSGVALSADGTRLAVSSPGSIGFPEEAIVQVFDWTGSSWVQAGLDIVGQAGTSVSLSDDGSRLAVSSGLVQVYEWTGTTWIEVGDPITNPVPNDTLGRFRAVALSGDGDSLIVGAPDARGGSGRAYVYRLDGTDWVGVGDPIETSAVVGTGIAVDIDLDGSHVIVGSGLGRNGVVQVYRLISTGWSKLGADIDGPDDTSLGQSVSIDDSGTVVAVGARRSGDQAQGEVTVFALAFPVGWSVVDEPVQGEPFESFGAKVTLSADGTSFAATGAPTGQDGGVFVRVYQVPDSASPWEKVGTDIVLDTDVNPVVALAMSDDVERVALGLPKVDNSAGVAHVFGRPIPPAPLLCNGMEVTIDLSQPGANGTGTPGDDVILGTPGDDVINALAGDDTVCAGAGDDNVSAGEGNDVVVAGDGDDVVFGEGGRDILRGGPGADQVHGGDGDDRVLGGVGGDTMTGGEGDDYLGGFGGADTIDGGPGNERIFGGFGADTISGGPGNDVISGLIGDDTISGGPGNDRLDGDRGNDMISGGPGDDRIRGGNANDVLNGDDGDDDVSGGKADDALSGGLGTDTCAGNLEFVADTTDGTCETEFGIP